MVEVRSQPLFIVGVTRSGTTFLYRLLGEHPEVRLGYESKLMTEGWELYRRLPVTAHRADFDRVLESLARLDEDEKLNRWMVETLRGSGDWLYEVYRQSGSFATFVEEVFQVPGAVSCWGNKMLRVELVPRLREHWPGARFVLLVRDPRAVFASQKLKFGSRRPAYSGIYWDLHARWTERLRHDPDSVLVVRYEDLVRDPEPRLREILEFARLDPAGAASLLEAEPVRAEGVEKWRQSLDPREVAVIEGICFESLATFGYEAELARRPVALSGFRRGLEAVLENARQVPLNPAAWRRKRLLQRFWTTVRG